MMNPFKRNVDSTSLLNRLWNKVEKLDKIRGDGMINFKRAGGGITANINMAAIRKKLPRGGSGGGAVHKAFPVADAGAGATIECYLDTDATGEEITVNCSIAGGTDLNEAIPKLTNGLTIFVRKFGTDWHCVNVFQAYEECTCEQEDAVFNSVTIASDEKLTLSGVGGDTFIRHNSADGEVEHTVEGDKVTTW
jgi:hypothetical protein